MENISKPFSAMPRMRGVYVQLFFNIDNFSVFFSPQVLLALICSGQKAGKMERK